MCLLCVSEGKYEILEIEYNCDKDDFIRFWIYLGRVNNFREMFKEKYVGLGV